MLQRNIYDNTTVSGARTCLRQVYFRHVRKWAGTGREMPLVFGSAWHAGQDTLWTLVCKDKEIDNRKIVRTVMDTFMTSWEENNGPSLSDLSLEEIKKLGARTPAVAEEMFASYLEERLPLLTDPTFELIEVEKPFVVPLSVDDPSLIYVGKLDKAFSYKGKVRIMEHKTTSSYKKKTHAKDVPFKKAYITSWNPSSQVDGYCYAAHLLYGEAFGGLWVDAALVHAKERGFTLIPVKKSLAQLDSWLYETLYWIGIIKGNEKHLNGMREAHEGNELPFLSAFPRNTNSCFDWNRPCPYIEFCVGYANPEKITGVPVGFEEKAWAPFPIHELKRVSDDT